MKFLVVGLGSMGKRRIRNLQHLGVTTIAGFDPREDRRSEAEKKYCIPIFDSFQSALSDFGPSALIISTPPSLHTYYIKCALDININCFIEASVTDTSEIYSLSLLASAKDLIVAPSCTMKYYPGPAKVKELLFSGNYGRPLSFTYYSGQYLPDWHPWEDIQDFYVSERQTGGCREIVPFELTWLNDLFGHPKVLSSCKTKLSDMSADIDDIYQINLLYPGRVLGSLIVDVLSRPEARREMFINLEQGQIVYSAHEQVVRSIHAKDKTWNTFALESGTIENQYINPEEPYIRELQDFINACLAANQNRFPNTLLRDWSILDLLDRIDEVATSF